MAADSADQALLNPTAGQPHIGVYERHSDAGMILEQDRLMNRIHIEVGSANQSRNKMSAVFLVPKLRLIPVVDQQIDALSIFSALMPFGEVASTRKVYKKAGWDVKRSISQCIRQCGTSQSDEAPQSGKSIGDHGGYVGVKGLFFSRVSSKDGECLQWSRAGDSGARSRASRLPIEPETRHHSGGGHG